MTRPRSPKGVFAFGLFFVVVALALLPWAISHPFDTTRRGIPIWVIPPALFVCGAFFVAQGAVWLRRDRRK
ncbi:hypothetical protein ACFSBZ_00795 [Amnibacterium flavum]|uniref:Uncharacterized protein n=1 Tax=Amnibacterium flavum TaxID=2173173 RepID=A0A2V1HPK5_9MICO|nr:hypothetical protein [Amnibacterium flavum]PVZ93542.1 hypothetical protein DDQ50_14590 [Amnibacterium flavum]